jgi:hypothetical protein
VILSKAGTAKATRKKQEKEKNWKKELYPEE